VLNDSHPTFAQVYRCLQRFGPACVVSSRGTEYVTTAEIVGERETIVARPRSGAVRIHEDCWGKNITCQRTRAGGIFNGSPSIYDWYHEHCEQA
jgi:hypothetical protein